MDKEKVDFRREEGRVYNVSPDLMSSHTMYNILLFTTVFLVYNLLTVHIIH